jgi:hypothetical protein
MAFRCIYASPRSDHFCKDRFNQHAARNDTLPWPTEWRNLSYAQ